MNLCPNCAQEIEDHASWCPLNSRHETDESIMQWWLDYVFPNLEEITFH